MFDLRFSADWRMNQEAYIVLPNLHSTFIKISSFKFSILFFYEISNIVLIGSRNFSYKEYHNNLVTFQKIFHGTLCEQLFLC